MARARKPDTEERPESAESTETAPGNEVQSETGAVDAPAVPGGDAETPTSAEAEPAAGGATEPVRRTSAEPSGPEVPADPEPWKESQPAAPAEPRRRGGFVPMLLGGAAAAGLGFGAATYVLPGLLKPQVPVEELNALNERLSVQDGRFSELLQDLAALKSGVADRVVADTFAKRTDALDSRIGEVQGRLDSIDARLGEQSGALGDLGARLTELEKRPVASGAASASALEAFGREMEAMRSEIAAQRVEADKAQKDIAAAAQTASERMAAIVDEAQRLRQDAANTAQAAAARAALTRLRSALDSGAALDSALADLKSAGIAIPTALADQSQGVPTMAALRDAFPPAARDALSVSVKEAAGGGAWDRLGAFLRSQTGARSLRPRAGDDPDAVLSRAEAALGAGDLAMAVFEIGSLPPNGQARMAEWVTLAQRRIDAMQAVDEVGRAME